MKSIIIRRIVIAMIIIAIVVLCFFGFRLYYQKSNTNTVAKEKFLDYFVDSEDEIIYALDTLKPESPRYINTMLSFLYNRVEKRQPVSDQSFDSLERLIRQDSTPLRMGMLHYIKSRHFFGSNFYQSYNEALAAKECFLAAKDTTGLIRAYVSLAYRYPSNSTTSDAVNDKDIKANKSEFLRLSGLSKEPVDQVNYIYTILCEDEKLLHDISYYESLFNKMMNISNKAKRISLLYNNYSVMANIYRLKGYHKKGDSLLLLKLKIANCEEEHDAIYDLVYSKDITYNFNTDSVISFLKASIDSYEYNHIKDPNFLIRNYDFLAENYFIKKDYKNAYVYRSKKDSIETVINEAEAQGQISSIENKYKLKQKDFEIKTAEREKERIFFFLVMSILLAAIACYMGYYNYKARLKLVELNDQQDDIKRVISHDLLSPLNSLEALTARLSKGLVPGTESAADANRQQLYIQNIRSLCHNLVGWLWNDRTVNESKVSGKELLDELVYDLEGFFSSYQCVVEMDVPEYFSDTAIKDPNAIKVILRNLLTNSVRHGKSSRIKIKMESKSSKLVVSIQDNGYLIDEELAAELQDFLNGKSDSTSITGLGLYLTGKFLSRIKGKYEIRQSNEEGFVNKHVVTIRLQKIIQGKFSA